jgi:hypothetical protein
MFGESVGMVRPVAAGSTDRPAAVGQLHELSCPWPTNPKPVKEFSTIKQLDYRQSWPHPSHIPCPVVKKKRERKQQTSQVSRISTS